MRRGTASWGHDRAPGRATLELIAKPTESNPLYGDGAIAGDLLLFSRWIVALELSFSMSPG